MDCERKISGTIECSDLENQLANVADGETKTTPPAPEAGKSKALQPPPPPGRAVRDNIFIRQDLQRKV